MRPKHKCQHCQYKSGLASVYIHTRYTKHNSQRCTTARAQGWPHKKDDVAQDVQKYWPIRHELAMIDGMAIKDKQITIPSQVHTQILIQLHSNHMGIKKTRLVAQTCILVRYEC